MQNRSILVVSLHSFIMILQVDLPTLVVIETPIKPSLSNLALSYAAVDVAVALVVEEVPLEEPPRLPRSAAIDGRACKVLATIKVKENGNTNRLDGSDQALSFIDKRWCQKSGAIVDESNNVVER
jgi:hypothetical protein